MIYDERPMSPTIFWEKGYRFLFFSREEPRMHVHAQCPRGEAKFWLEPEIAMAKNMGLSEREIRIIEEIIKEHENEIRKAWRTHFPG
jgi:hypothetical protein